MANPNIVAVKSILGQTALASVSSSYAALISNSDGSGTIIKVDSLTLANNDTAGHSVSVDVSRGGTSYPITTNTSIAVGAAYDVISKYIYLNEGDSLRVKADTSATGQVTAVASYVTIKETV
jgi:hypothetical protein